MKKIAITLIILATLGCAKEMSYAEYRRSLTKGLSQETIGLIMDITNAHEEMGLSIAESVDRVEYILDKVNKGVIDGEVIIQDPDDSENVYINIRY